MGGPHHVLAVTLSCRAVCLCANSGWVSVEVSNLFGQPAHSDLKKLPQCLNSITFNISLYYSCPSCPCNLIENTAIHSAHNNITRGHVTKPTPHRLRNNTEIIFWWHILWRPHLQGIMGLWWWIIIHSYTSKVSQQSYNNTHRLKVHRLTKSQIPAIPYQYNYTLISLQQCILCIRAWAQNLPCSHWKAKNNQNESPL